REGYAMFQQMMGQIREESVGYLYNLEVEVHRTGAAERPAEVEAKGLGIPASNAQQLHYSAPNDAGEVEIRDGRGQVEQAATARLRQAMEQRAAQESADAPAAEAPRGAFGQRTEGSEQPEAAGDRKRVGQGGR